MEKRPEVRFKVVVKITEENLRDFMMQRTYSNAGIIFPTGFGILFLYLAVTKMDLLFSAQWWAYFIFGFLFLFGVPINIWSRCRRDSRRSRALQEEVPYYLDDEGIYYGEVERDVLPWDKIHHIISTKKNVIIYATSKLAFYLPKECIEDYEGIREFLYSKMEPSRIKMVK